MPLTHTRELFAKALKGKYAIGAFNVNNMELLQAIIDGSHLGFKENVALCKRVVEYAQKHNCVVEGELGMLLGAQHDDGEEGGGYSKGGVYTHPDEAVEFVQATGVDSLAVAIGNSHGAYKFKGDQHLKLDRLKAIKKALLDAGLGDYPLVLHGASSVPRELVQEINKYGGKLGEDTAGVPEADIEIARRLGCTKVNIDTDLRLAMTSAIRKVMWESPKEFDPRKYLAPARMKVKELVRHKVRNVLCCAGHAFD